MRGIICCQFLCQLTLVKLYYQLTDLNQDSSHTYMGKIRKTLKNDRNFDAFC